MSNTLFPSAVDHYVICYIKMYFRIMKHMCKKIELESLRQCRRSNLIQICQLRFLSYAEQNRVKPINLQKLALKQKI